MIMTISMTINMLYY